MDLDTLRLLHRFPGYLGQAGHVASQMAEHMGGRGPWTWYDIRPSRPGGYVAYVYGRTSGQRQPYRFPVLPDEHNPDSQKRVGPEDAPYVFCGAVEAEAAARQAADVLRQHLQGCNARMVEGAIRIKQELPGGRS